MSITIVGDKRLIRMLEQLPNKVFRKGLLSAGRKAMKPVIAIARARAPVDSGTLKKSIGIKVKVYRQTGTAAFVVGARKGFGTTIAGRPRDPYYYAHLVELGHEIRLAGQAQSRRKGAPKLPSIGRVEAIPFLKPAMDSQKPLIVSIFSGQIGAMIEREAKKS